MAKKAFSQALWEKDVVQLKNLSKKENYRLVHEEVKKLFREFAQRYDFSRFAQHALREMQETLERIA